MARLVSLAAQACELLFFFQLYCILIKTKSLKALFLNFQTFLHGTHIEPVVTHCEPPYLSPWLTDTNNLYLTCLKGTYAFPLSSLTAIQIIKKRIRIMEWHKEIPYNKGVYKQFHLSSDYYGCIHCNSYYILELAHCGISYGIYIPCYDISILEKFTGLKAQ